MGQNFSSEPVVEKETERAHNDLFNVAVSSCQGWRMSQEDNHSMILDLSGEHKAAFFAVYDGHGSARVSKHASESLWRHLVENDLYAKGNFKEALESAFLTFDREVNESYNAQLAGTTAVCLLIVDNIIYCANIGDSRGVACINCECVPLSYDHKPENPLELKRIMAAGGYVLGNRVNGNLALSRAFGDFHYKGNQQLPPEQQIVSPCPDIKLIELNDDVDFLVLACDGIWDVLSSDEVVEFVIARLEQSLEPGIICEELTTRCLATDYELVIGCDNMTVLLVCYTRGRSWADYCTDIFNKNTTRLKVSGIRERPIGLGTGYENSEAVNYSRTTDEANILSPIFNESVSSSLTEEVDNVETNPGVSDEKEAAVLRQVDQEPELEQTCTVSEIPDDRNEQDVDTNKQEEGAEDKEQQCIIEEVDKINETESETTESQTAAAATTTTICQQEEEETAQNEESKGSDTMCKTNDKLDDAAENDFDIVEHQNEAEVVDKQDDNTRFILEEEGTQQEEEEQTLPSDQNEKDEMEEEDEQHQQESNSDSTSQSNEVVEVES